MYLNFLHEMLDQTYTPKNRFLNEKKVKTILKTKMCVKRSIKKEEMKGRNNYIIPNKSSKNFNLTSHNEHAYVSTLSCPETVINAGFLKKSCLYCRLSSFEFFLNLSQFSCLSIIVVTFEKKERKKEKKERKKRKEYKPYEKKQKFILYM